jgi:Zn-dependent peptidase ImmA (M78 family)
MGDPIVLLDDRYQPDFDAEDKQASLAPRHQMAKELARKCIKEFRVKGPAVDVESMVRARGITLLRVDTESTMSGALYADVKEIAINTRGRSPERQRFTIAHEFGHWEFRHHLLAELPPDSLGYAGVFEDGPDPRSAVEIEANVFAAELLMPGAWLRKLSKPLAIGLPQKLAQEYQVSKEAMFYQLMSCGRLT